MTQMIGGAYSLWQSLHPIFFLAEEKRDSASKLYAPHAIIRYIIKVESNMHGRCLRETTVDAVWNMKRDYVCSAIQFTCKTPVLLHNRTVRLYVFLCYHMHNVQTVQTVFCSFRTHVSTRSLAVAERPCDCCVGQFWHINVTGRRYFADIIQGGPKKSKPRTHDHNFVKS